MISSCHKIVRTYGRLFVNVHLLHHLLLRCCLLLRGGPGLQLHGCGWLVAASLYIYVSLGHFGYYCLRCERTLALIAALEVFVCLFLFRNLLFGTAVD